MIHDYFKIKDRISNSFLSAYKRKLMGKMPRVQSEKNLRFGRGFHQLLLEPQKFNKYHYQPREYMQMLNMVESVKDAIDPELFTGKIEHEYYFNLHGFKFKLKSDITHASKSLIIDFKTTGAYDEFSFAQHVVDYDYNRQGSIYLDCPRVKSQNINTFMIIGVMKQKPFTTFKYILDRDHPLMEAGREEYMYLLDEFRNDKTEDVERFISNSIEV